MCLGCKVEAVTGSPDPKHISTSYAERQNLTMRMSMRRFTRLTNAFSKKVENHAAAIALYFMYYTGSMFRQSLAVLLLPDRSFCSIPHKRTPVPVQR